MTPHRWIRGLARASFALALAGCTAPQGATQAVTGQIDTTQFRLMNAQVFARSTLKRVFSAPVAADGTFRLVVQPGTYTLRFGNQTTSAWFYDAFAFVTAARPAGLRTHLIKLAGGPVIDFGRVGRLGTAGSGTPSAASPNHDEAEHDQEMEHEDDEEKICDVEHGGDDAEVDADSGAADHEAADDGTDVEHEVEMEADAPCGGGSTTPPAGTPPPVNGVI
jgi:hypothetical protein